MLKGLDPILNADLLLILSCMGHGDDLIIADSNFPSASMAKRLVRMPGLTAPRVLEAVLSVMPLDDFRRRALCADRGGGRSGCRARSLSGVPDRHRSRRRGPVSAGENRAICLLRASTPSLRRGADRRNASLRLCAAENGRGPARLIGSIQQRAESRGLFGASLTISGKTTA